jgi:hypothetical protein
MSTYLVAPLLLAGLCLGWFAVQRAWVAAMRRPSDSDALDRPGGCGRACACRAECDGRRQQAPMESVNREPTR